MWFLKEIIRIVHIYGRTDFFYIMDIDRRDNYGI